MCSSGKEKNPFGLKVACKDCPFRKSNSYLHPERVAEIIQYMSHDDQLFPCHKTVNNEARAAYSEAVENIKWELEELSHLQDTVALRAELEKKYNLSQLEADLKHAMLNSEKICAGWLILGKKENLIQNNFLLRLALMNKLLTLNQFKNEEQIFDSVEEAIQTHKL